MITDKEKVRKYENLLHKLQMFYSVSMDSSRVKKLLENISAWSYAHRVGNGMLSDEEQQERIDEAFHRLTDIN